MKKIIFVARALWIGGVEKSLISLLNYIDYDKFDVTCLITSNNTTLLEQIDKRCHVIVCDRRDVNYRYFKIYGLGEDPVKPSPLHKAFMWTVPIFKAIEQRLYAKYLKDHLESEYDIAIIYDVYVAELAVRAIKANRFLMFYHHGTMGHAYHDEIGYKKSDKIIVVSNALCKKMQTKNPKYANKMISIHNIIDVDNIINGSKASASLSDKFNIVSCGRLSYEKGMDIAIKVCAKLVEDGMTNFHWYIVGGGREEHFLKKMAQELGLTDFISMTGEMTNPYPYIANADLFVQTSRFEAYGLTLIEALTLNIPIVATKTDGAKEILNNGELGILVEFEPNEIASKIENLFSNAKEYSYYKMKASQVDFRQKNSIEIKKLYRLMDN